MQIAVAAWLRTGKGACTTARKGEGMTQFASQTSVSSDRSRAEIESTLRRYGADSFAYVSERKRAIVAFQAQGRRVKFELPIPDPDSEEFTHTPARGTRRSALQAHDAWELLGGP